MLLTNNQNNTMRLYCGELPGMTHVRDFPRPILGPNSQSKNEVFFPNLR